MTDILLQAEAADIGVTFLILIVVFAAIGAAIASFFFWLFGLMVFRPRTLHAQIRYHAEAIRVLADRVEAGFARFGDRLPWAPDPEEQTIPEPGLSDSPSPRVQESVAAREGDQLATRLWPDRWRIAAIAIVMVCAVLGIVILTLTL